MAKITKAQVEVLSSIYAGLEIGKSYEIKSYLGGKVTVTVNDTTITKWNNWVASFTLSKPTLKVLLEKGLLVVLPQKNNFEDVYADYHNYSDSWKLSNEGVALCEELFGKIEQPVVETVTEIEVNRPQTIEVLETVEVVEIVEPQVVTTPVATTCLEKDLYNACYVTTYGSKLMVEGYTHIISQEDVTNIKANARNSELPTGQARTKACKDMAMGITYYYQNKKRLESQFDGASSDDANNNEGIEVEEIKVEEVQQQLATPIEISKHEVLASLLTSQELYIIYALVGKARQTATGGSQTHQQLEKLTDKVMNALSVVHHQQGNLDGLRCLCHNQKLVGSKCPRETVKLAS